VLALDAFAQIEGDLLAVRGNLVFLGQAGLKRAVELWQTDAVRALLEAVGDEILIDENRKLPALQRCSELGIERHRRRRHRHDQLIVRRGRRRRRVNNRTGEPPGCR
jgi:hypothetical protein